MTSLDVFWNSSLHGDSTRMGVRAFYVVEKKIYCGVFQNEYGDHAEDGVMKSIKSFLPHVAGSTLSITVFQSLSPCQRCSSRYQQLLEQARQNRVTLKLTIVFAGFYKVLRPSCQRKGCTHNVSTETHRQQLEGLRQLRDRGVKLRCFEFEDWNLAAGHLEESEMSKQGYQASKRAKEDANMKTDLQELGLRTRASLEDALLVELLRILDIRDRELNRVLTSLRGAHDSFGLT